MVKRFFKAYVVVWHDPDLDTEENKLHRAQLEKFCKIETFTEWDKASIYIRGTKKICHVITSGTKGELLTQEICSYENVLSIYVFCRNQQYHSSWAKNYKKIACVEIPIQNILNQIEEKLLAWYKRDSSLQGHFPAFAPIWNDTHKSQMNNLHRFLKVIPNFKNQEQAKYDFIALSKEIYSDKRNKNLLKEFEEDYGEYKREDVLKWYTKESFFYRVTNNCLRIATSDSIQYCRLPLRDIQKAIKEQYQMKSKNFNGLLYRAAPLSKEEWSNLKENLGREIETHGFLSTSKNKNVALKFLLMDLNKTVFITIIVPKSLTEAEQGFAEIEEFSKLKHEEEVLFNVRSRFTVLETEEKYSEELPCRHLVLLYGAQDLRRFVSEQNPVQEVLIADSFSCSQCKAPSSEMTEKMIFVPIINSGNDNYCCKKCLPNFVELDAAPLLCIIPNNLSFKLANPFKIEIKGCQLTKWESQIPFYGYKCSECQVKKQKMYFACTTCGESGKKWCESCFKNTPDCLKQGHTIMLESRPFSFWCQQMPKKELNHLRVQNSLVSENDFFQQAEMYVKSSEYEKAIEYYQTYIKQNETEDKDGKIAICYSKLGDIYKIKKEKKKAHLYYSKALDTKLSETHPVVANSYSGLGELFFIEGKLQRALEYHSKSLELRKSLYGNTHSDVAFSLKSIGVVYLELREHENALEYCLKSLEIESSVFEENHPNIANSKKRIGVIYSHQGEHDKALEYCLKGLEIETSVYGENHSDVAHSYFLIGRIYHKKEDNENALKYMLKSLDSRREVLGNTHPDVGCSYGYIGKIYQEKGQPDLALEFFEKSLNVIGKLSEEYHLDLIDSYENLGDAHRDLGEYEDALQYYELALGKKEILYGSTHLGVAASFYDIGRIHEVLGNGQMALEYSLKCLDIEKLSFEENRFEIAVSLTRIGNLYRHLEEYDKALEYYLESLDIERRIFGEDHLDIAKSEKRIGLTYCNLEKYEEALQYHLEALKIEISVYGENHLEVADSYHIIGAISEALGEYQQAVEYYWISHDISKSLEGDN